jgi:hypothetical protein
VVIVVVVSAAAAAAIVGKFGKFHFAGYSVCVD